MAETVVLQEPHTQAVVAALKAKSLRVGEGVAPEDESDGIGWQGAPGASDFNGYVVVHPIPGGTRTGVMDDPEKDITYVVDVMCIGATQQQAERLTDLASAAVKSVSITGRDVLQVRHDFGSAQVRRDDEPESELPALWYGSPRFRIWTTPASGPA